MRTASSRRTMAALLSRATCGPSHVNHPCAAYFHSSGVASEGGLYYTRLGVEQTASQEEIKAAFIRRAKEAHPDVNNSTPEAVEAFRCQLIASNQILTLTVLQHLAACI